MNKPETNVLPPPPPPTVSFSEIERIEGLASQLEKVMKETNIRRRFKMSTYLDWCNKATALHTELKKLRGAS